MGQSGVAGAGPGVAELEKSEDQPKLRFGGFCQCAHEALLFELGDHMHPRTPEETRTS